MPERVDTKPDAILESLAELRRAQPSLRLGQLIASLAMVARGDAVGAVWEVEDEELAAAIHWQIAQLHRPSADKVA